jgi:catechol 2,3-dioxygenase-like lactoylglutathione lyase family enzyme
VEQRLSLVTLGVTDLARARSFYEALGWVTGAAPGDDVVFFQAGGMILALWGRLQLADDSGVTDAGGWGGYSGVFVDPDGHPWEVAHNPHWTLRDDGSISLSG